MCAKNSNKPICKIKCSDFLQIYINNSWLSVYEYINYCTANKIDPDSKIKELTFKYRDKKYTFDKYNLELQTTSQKFKSDIDDPENLPDDELVFKYDKNLYRSLKFFRQVGYNISAAYYYANNSYNKLPETFNHIKSYPFYFLKRSFDFTTAIMWYNSCFDYLLQAFCARFSLYELIDENFNYEKPFNELVKLVNIEKINNLGLRDNLNRELNIWLKNLNQCKESLTALNNTTNMLKHRGGVNIAYFNFKPSSIIQIGNSSNIECFNIPDIDIDEDFNLLINSHNNIVQCYSFLLNKLFKDILNSQKAFESNIN